jgi:hypothetical protein
MCEEFVELDMEYGEDFLDYEEPPSKPKYYPAQPPAPLSDRLNAYKYDLKFREFVRELHGLFPPFVLGQETPPKKKMLCVRMGTEHFVLEPISAEQKTPYTEVGMFGVTQRYPTAPPNITLTTHVHCKTEALLSLKYQYLRQQFQHANPMVAKICGQNWYATDIDFMFGPDAVLSIMFTLPSNVGQGRHRLFRNAEAEHKKRFAKFASFK